MHRTFAMIETKTVLCSSLMLRNKGPSRFPMNPREEVGHKRTKVRLTNCKPNRLGSTRRTSKVLSLQTVQCGNPRHPTRTASATTRDWAAFPCNSLPPWSPTSSENGHFSRWLNGTDSLSYSKGNFSTTSSFLWPTWLTAQKMRQKLSCKDVSKLSKNLNPKFLQ